VLAIAWSDHTSCLRRQAGMKATEDQLTATVTSVHTFALSCAFNDSWQIQQLHRSREAQPLLQIPSMHASQCTCCAMDT